MAVTPPRGGSQTYHFQLLSKNVFSSVEEAELYELCNLAGVTMDPNVFKILLDLLKMNVPPTAIVQMLRTMTSRKMRTGTSETTAGGRQQRPAPKVSTMRGRSSSESRASKKPS